MQSLNAFGQCYFSSNPNKKAVEQAVKSHVYSNQIQEYAMMNLSKYFIGKEAEMAQQGSDSILRDQQSRANGFSTSIFSMGHQPTWQKSDNAQAETSAAEVPLVR